MIVVDMVISMMVDLLETWKVGVEHLRPPVELLPVPAGQPYHAHQPGHQHHQHRQHQPGGQLHQHSLH